LKYCEVFSQTDVTGKAWAIVRYLEYLCFESHGTNYKLIQ